MAQSRKAWLRATREIVGMSQQEVADAVGVRVLTVKRWEKQGFPEPPEDVCQWMLAARENHDQAVDEMVAALGRGKRAVIDFYRSQEDCDREFGGTEGAGVPYGYRNAIARSAAERLCLAGVDVVWRYPDEEIVGVREV